MNIQIESELEDITRKHKEVKYLLWQSLLTVDGFLLTVAVGISAFGSINNIIIKLFIELIIILLFTSIGLIILNFYFVREMYSSLNKIAMNISSGGDLPTKEEMRLSEKRAGQRGNLIINIENWTLILQGLVAFLLIITITYFLFSPSANFNSHYRTFHYSHNLNLQGRNFSKISY